MKPVTVRLPDDTADQIAALADRERRSVSAQVVVLIERGLVEAQESMER